jgi:hypothetical protein
MTMSEPTQAALVALPTTAESYLIAEEFCGGCGESIGFDVQPLTLRCPLCSLIWEADRG